MIKFTYNNKPIYLADNTKISMSEINPLFVRDKNSISLQFKIPYSGNEDALEYIKLNYLTTKLNNVNIAYGSFYMQGTLKINEISEEIIATFKPNNNFNIKDDKTLISDLPFKSYDAASVTNDYPENGGEVALIEFRWPKFWDTTQYQDDVTFTVNDGTHGNLHVFTPYVSKFLNTLFEKQGYIIKENDIETNVNDFIKHLVFIVNNATLNNYKLTTHYNTTVKSFFESLINTLGIIPYINDIERTVSFKLAKNLINQNPVDISKYCGKIQFTPKAKKTGFFLKMKAPTKEEFASPYVNIYENIDGMLADPVATYSDLPITDDYKTIRKVENNKNYYRFERIQDPNASGEVYIDSWELFSFPSTELLKGDINNAWNIEGSIFPAVEFESDEWNFGFIKFNSQGNSKYHYEQQDFQMYYGYPSNGSMHAGVRGTENQFIHQFLNEDLAFFYINSVPAEIHIDPEVFLLHGIHQKFYAHGYVFMITEREYAIEQNGIKETRTKILVES